MLGFFMLHESSTISVASFELYAWLHVDWL